MMSAKRNGFTLLEVMVSLTILAIMTAIAVPSSLRFVSFSRLTYTQQALYASLQLMQDTAQKNGQFAQVRASLYTPYYALYEGTTWFRSRTFLPGVQYHDGYLQMNTGQFTYDVLGDSQIAGTIRLVSDGAEKDIHLFMGTGYFTVGGMGS